jgi:hypothetical protein
MNYSRAPRPIIFTVWPQRATRAFVTNQVQYEPGAIVYHQVLPHQLERKYLLTIHYNAGFQKAFYDGTSFRRRILGIPPFIYPQFARATGKYLGQLVTRGPDEAFRQLMTVGHFLGTMAGYRKAYREVT